MKKRKKEPEGQEGGSSSEEGSDSGSSSSESEMTSETEEEQAEPASWRKKTVSALGQEQDACMDRGPPQPLGQAQASPHNPARARVLPFHTHIPLFSSSLPAAKVPLQPRRSPCLI